MVSKKKTKTTRRQVSGERMIALQLTDLLEACMDGDGDKITDACDRAQKTLDGLGYAGLESISSRVSNLETAIEAAVKARDGKEIARLGAELNRAQRGLPPIEKKAVKAKAATAAPAAGDSAGKSE